MQSIMIWLVLVFCFFPSTGAMAADISGPDAMPGDVAMPGRSAGVTEGTGNHFAVKDSEDRDLTVDSTHKVTMQFESLATMVIMRIDASTATPRTTLTVTGLVPGATYYKYEDSYENVTPFAADAAGSYSFTQDVSARHVVFILTVKSTKYLRDDATGGDCLTIGDWDAATRTCTLTTDVYETIQIESNSVSIDGNGHLVAPGWRVGIYVPYYITTGVNIRNVTVSGAIIGIWSYSSNSTITNNTIRYCWKGLSLETWNSTITNNSFYGNYDNSLLIDRGSTNLIENNSFSGNGGYGIYVRGSYNMVKNNILENNYGGGILLYDSLNNTLRGNIMNNNTYNLVISDLTIFVDLENDIDTSNLVNGKPVYFLKDVNNQTFDASTNAGMFFCLRCSNIVVKDLTLSNNGYGLLLYQTTGARVENVITTANSAGMYIYSSTNNTFVNNTLSDNNYGMFFVMASNNLVYNNSFSNTNQVRVYSSTNSYSMPAPVGGNWWSTFDTASEGCFDANVDGFCDASYSVAGGVDYLPWWKPEGWISDENPPSSGAVLSGTEGNNGWYISDVQVSITASDAQGESGVKEIRYILDGVETIAPGSATAFAIAAEGAHDLAYYAVDNAGNTEAAHPLTISIDKTFPGISSSQSPLPNLFGWNNTVTVSFSCSDAVSGIASCTSPIVPQTEGEKQLITGTATDNAGLSTPATSELNIDLTAPVVAAAASPAANAFGWNNSAVTVSFICSDALSGVASCPAARTISTEGPAQMISGEATDRADNTASTSVTLNIDTTMPVITAAAAPAPNAAGWNNTPVTVTFTCTDSLSGIAACPAAVIAAADGSGQAISGTAADKAGNGADASVTVNIDQTAPVIRILGVQNGATYALGLVPVASFTVSDGLSGVASSGAGLTGGDGFGLGTFTYSVNAADNAGNTATTAAVYTVIATAEGLEALINQFLNSGAIDSAGIANSLLAKLDRAIAARDSGNTKAFENMMNAFINEIEAQSGKHIEAGAAAILIHAATAML